MLRVYQHVTRKVLVKIEKQRREHASFYTNITLCSLIFAKINFGLDLLLRMVKF